MMTIISRTGSLALIAVFGILLVFFFPAHCGAFRTTHEPATVFRALEAAKKLFAALSAALLIAASRLTILYLQCATPRVAQTSCDPTLFALRC
jgi:hypothetical protein